MKHSPFDATISALNAEMETSVLGVAISALDAETPALGVAISAIVQSFL